MRNAFPTCAIPKGGRILVELITLAKFTKIPWAVSGRRYTWALDDSTGPTNVLNIRLNWRASVNSPPSSSWRLPATWSARNR